MMAFNKNYKAVQLLMTKLFYVRRQLNRDFLWHWIIALYLKQTDVTFCYFLDEKSFKNFLPFYSRNKYCLFLVYFFNFTYLLLFSFLILYGICFLNFDMHAHLKVCMACLNTKCDKSKLWYAYWNIDTVFLLLFLSYISLSQRSSLICGVNFLRLWLFFYSILYHFWSRSPRIP